jgi:Isochorismatase family
VLCGVQTPNCIRTGAYDGVSLGYHVTVLADATASKSQEVQDANLRGTICTAVAAHDARSQGLASYHWRGKVSITISSALWLSTPFHMELHERGVHCVQTWRMLESGYKPQQSGSRQQSSGTNAFQRGAATRPRYFVAPQCRVDQPQRRD